MSTADGGPPPIPPVYVFEPDDSPDKKGAVAGANKGDVLKNGQIFPSAGKHGQVNAPGKGPANAQAMLEDGGKEGTPESPPTMPGDIDSAAAADLPDWYKVGWRAVTGQDHEETELDRQRSIFHEWVSEQYYGDWYHNAAVIVFAVLATHFMTRFHLSFAWTFLILATCATYYTTSIARVRRRARDDIQRSLVKTRLINEHESADWINNFLDRFWLIYEPILSAAIVATVDQILSAYTPAFCESVRLTTFTLGNKAPRIDRVRTFPNTAEDVVTMDWAFSFTPSDVSDLPQKEAKKRAQPKIVLNIKLGKGIASAGIPVLLEDINFVGEMRLRIKLMTKFPHAQTVDICFLDKPQFDYVLKPIGGEHFGFDIGNIPGLNSFIKDMVHSILGPMMYDPNVFTLNLEQMLAGAPLDTAIGVLQITVHAARSLKAAKIGGGTPDPYISLSLSSSQGRELARTAVKSNTYNPAWGPEETKFILVNSLTDSLLLNVMDFNDHRKDTEVGVCTWELGQLKEDASREGVVERILKDGKERGEVRFDVNFFPVFEKEKQGTEEMAVGESNVGIVRLTIHQAKDLDHSKSSSGDLNPFARLYITDSHVSSTYSSTPSEPHFTSKRLKHTSNPVWECATEFFVPSRSTTSVTLHVIDDRDFLKDPVVGSVSVPVEKLLEAGKPKVGPGSETGELVDDWFRLDGCRSGRIRMKAEWKPVNMAGSVQGAGAYIPPIGVVRLWMKKAIGLKNVEAALGGKSDPYVRVQVRNVTMARTEVVNNNLNPEWDQIIYIPVHSLKETLLLECMDYQHLTKDRSLGSTELHVWDIAKEADPPSSDGKHKVYPYQGTGRKECSEKLRLDQGGGYKGELVYEAEFVPAVRMRDVSFGSGGIGGQKTAPPRGEIVGKVVEEKTAVDAVKDEARKSVDTAKSEKEGEKDAKVKETGDVQGKPVMGGEQNGEAHGEKCPEKDEDEEGVELTKEQLLKYQSGIIVFRVTHGHLRHKCRVQVLLDDAYWPCMSTPRATSLNARWDHVGEGFVKELDFGQVVIRLNESESLDQDKLIGEVKVETAKFLEDCLDGPREFVIRKMKKSKSGDGDEFGGMDRVGTTATELDGSEGSGSEGNGNGKEGKVSTVWVEARYIPVDIKLEPRESINNQGVLRVSLLDGKGIHGVDRSGKSDPFAVFTLNDAKVYKSQTKKKTLTPEWNEEFEVSVPSRVGANFAVEVFDWNQIEQAKSLGAGPIDLSELEPLSAREISVPLIAANHKTGQQEHRGEVRVRLLFTPRIIMKSRKNTSTFSSAGRALTQIGGLPVGAGKGVFHGVGNVAKGLGGLFKDEKDNQKGSSAGNGGPVAANDFASPNGGAAPAPPPAGYSVQNGDPGMAFVPSQPTAIDSSGNVFGQAGSSSEIARRRGMLRVSVQAAKDLPAMEGDHPKPYAAVRVGDKVQKTKHTARTQAPEWCEDLDFYVEPATNGTAVVTVMDHKSFGKDKVIGECHVDFWQQLAQSALPDDIWVPLRDGQGQVCLRFSISEDVKKSPSRHNVASLPHSFGHRATDSASMRSLRNLRQDSDE